MDYLTKAIKKANNTLAIGIVISIILLILAFIRYYVFPDFFDNLFNREIKESFDWEGLYYDYIDKFIDDKDYYLLFVDIDENSIPELVIRDSKNNLMITYYKDDEVMMSDSYNNGRIDIIYSYEDLVPRWMIYNQKDNYYGSYIYVNNVYEGSKNFDLSYDNYLELYNFYKKYYVYKIDLPYLVINRDNFEDKFGELCKLYSKDNYFTKDKKDEMLGKVVLEYDRLRDRNKSLKQLISDAKKDNKLLSFNDKVLLYGTYTGFYTDIVTLDDGSLNLEVKSLLFNLNESGKFKFRDLVDEYQVGSDFLIGKKSLLKFKVLDSNLFYLESEDMVFELNI